MSDELRDFGRNEPYPLEKMEFRNPENTICELLRRTYKLVENEEAKLNIRICMTMAKKMGDKLHNYRKGRDGDA